ncbi:MAG: Signal transduction histidine kinase [Thermodesulfobacteria bacterium]|nr:HAMP domain-containing histidine kinase [Thermodesulfobacteriota bacterium]MCU4138663.1 Signal transduction histidine kinase [Thermodesulfobacteriota bacterium]
MSLISKYRNLWSAFILWIIVLISSGILIVSAIFTYKNTKLTAEDALKMQALGIAITLQSFLQSVELENLRNLDYKIFSEIILNEKWEGVAFISLYDENGYIILHSNPDLIGKKIELIKNSVYPYYHYLTLKTSEKVFVADFKIPLNSTYILRIALHTYPAEIIIKRAQIYAGIKIGASIGLILFGILGTLLIKKVEKMQMKLKELESISIMTKILAHEIRNPLGSIKGFSQYLLNKVEEKFKDPLKIIFNETLRIERLTDELLLYTNPVKITIAEFSLKELLEEILIVFKNDYPEITFQLNFNQEIKLKSDKDKLKEIIINLLQNAVDAVLETSKDQKIIELNIEKRENKIKFEIVDNGIGMDEETLIKAMEPFFSTKPKGSGLGLAIVKKLCEALNIRFKINSKKGEGTRICLIIPESL